jgi:uncharacterized membrane protein YphA (DoxX/SURF4 family)
LRRVACAAAFLYHVSRQCDSFGAPDGPGPQNFSAFLHAPAINGYLVEPAILTGVLFRAGAACIINLVIGAIFLVHPSQLARAASHVHSLNSSSLFSVLLSGPGAYSLAGILPPLLPKL